MKYLKSFNESVSTQEGEWSDILQNIKDICLDLSDDGFSVSYRVPHGLGYSPSGINISTAKSISLIVVISKVSKSIGTGVPKVFNGFKYNDVKDVVERLRYYLHHLPGYKSVVHLEAHPTIKSLLDDSLYQVMNVNIDIEKYRKVLESNSDIENDLEDICQELKDEGFSTYIPGIRGKGDNQYIVINAKSYNGRFKYIEVEEVVNRLKEYLGDRYTEEHILIYGRSGFGNWIDVTEDEIKRLELEDAEANIFAKGIGGVKINFEI